MGLQLMFGGCRSCGLNERFSMVRRVPTLEEYLSHTGLHYHQLWKQIGPSWYCISCRRSRFQIMRWSKRFPNTPQAFMDWVAIVNTHHDHAGDQPGCAPRFPRTVLCNQCNAADGAAKRRLQLPQNFSFSPEEIGRFVISTPHAAHKLDYEVAHAIYQTLVRSKVFVPAPTAAG